MNTVLTEPGHIVYELTLDQNLATAMEAGLTSEV
jgi:hypothetical protein